MSKFILIGAINGPNGQPIIAQAVYHTTKNETNVPKYAINVLNETLKRQIERELTQEQQNMWEGPIVTHDPENPK